MKRLFTGRLQTGSRILADRLALSWPIGGVSVFSRIALRAGKPRWSKRHWLRFLGWPGMLGITILAVCPTFYFSALLPAQERLDAARQDTLSLHEQIQLTASGLNGGRLQPEEQLAEFYRIFPSDRHSPQWLRKIFAVAQRGGVSLDQGTYEASRDKVGKLMRFQITLPVKGEYARIRKFLAVLLSEVPIVSLEHIQFERQQVGDPEVEAKIKLVLYLERES